MNIRIPQSGKAAAIAREYLKSIGIEVKHTQALELIAQLHGYQNAQAMKADKRFAAKPYLKAIASNVYEFSAAKGSAVWVDVENICVQIKRDDEGVVVDMHPKKNAGGESLASTWLLYNEADDLEFEPSENAVLKP